MDELIIDYIEGNCPVQGAGAINGKPFYFRARGSTWTFEVYEDEDSSKTIYIYQEQYGDTLFAAGWMEPEEAEVFIRKAADLYVKENN